MVKASAGRSFTAQFENASIPLPIGGQMKLRIAPTAMTMNDVMIGTERLPAKNPRYGGSWIL